MLSLTNTSDRESDCANVALFGPIGVGKTAVTATAMGLGPVLYMSTSSEGDSAGSISEYEIPMLKIRSYGDLVGLYHAIAGKIPEEAGELPISKLSKSGKFAPYAPSKSEVAELTKQMKKLKPRVIVFDTIIGLQQLFAEHSIWYWGKDIGIGKYGDIAELTRYWMFKFMAVEGLRMLVWISTDKQVADNDRGTTYREMAFEGNKSREIIPPACSFVLPLFTGEDLGLAEEDREWIWKYRDSNGNVKEEPRDRFFALQPRNGYWAKARGPVTQTANVMPANLALLYKKFYGKKVKKENADNESSTEPKS